MSKPDHLNRVIAAFEQWRLTKNKHQTIIPTPLRQQAVALLDEYSSSKITAALRLSGSQLKSWAGLHPLDEQALAFVQLPRVSALPQQTLSIALHFRHGGQLTLSGEMSPALLSAIIREMNT